MNPDEFTIAEHMLDVGHKHQLYIQDWGNKKCKTPIIFLHGGPGDGCKDKHKMPFDPKTQRVIFFDQRGSGKSLPLGHWHHNNTQELAADITKIANFLKIDKFILTGYSWGSTLALYYAICEPRRVKALVIGGVWTCSQEELDWLNIDAAKVHFPDVWEQFVASVPKSAAKNPVAWHLERMFGKDEESAKRSAWAYSQYLSGLMRLSDLSLPRDCETFDPTSMILEARFTSKRCFLPDRFILKNAKKLKMPVYIVQGRYDFACPPKYAYEVHKAIPNSHLTWVVSGHRGEHETVTAQRLIYKHLVQ